MYVHDYVYIYIVIYAIYALFNVVAVCFTLPRLLLISSLFIYRQISCFLSANPVFEGSTETPLLHLLSDIYGAVDSSQLTLLALFDVSAAFDTVDHEILLKRLDISFGLSGNFLSWVGSFLSERSLCVVHLPSRSAWVPAPYGLPQGSVLGPLLYIIYTSEIGPLLAATSVLGHL